MRRQEAFTPVEQLFDSIGGRTHLVCSSILICFMLGARPIHDEDTRSREQADAILRVDCLLRFGQKCLLGWRIDVLKTARPLRGQGHRQR